MQLIDYVNIIRRRWWIILLAGLVAAASAYAFTRFQERVYRSEASYQVIPSRYDNGLLIVLRDRMNSFKSIALAPIQLEKISADLKLDRSADWLLNKRVAIQARPEEQLIVIQVDYPDADIAPRLANAIGDNMVGLVNAQNNSIEGTDRINLRVNQPARPAVLNWPQTRVIVPAGALLGLVLGLILAFILEALDDTLKTPADVERYAELPTLGAIPDVGERASGRADRGRQPA
ncbi:MAG: lipopolysaccharide biosynthesis protein [Roseiflexaceae bacterium]|nr:lipopolysaccharide biosynthesis protein [Roseiflexaceae bacterium]